jgi:hypothetical protein
VHNEHSLWWKKKRGKRYMREKKKEKMCERENISEENRMRGWGLAV